MAMTGGDSLVATLMNYDIDTAFGVSGESFLATLEALRRQRNGIRFIPTRHESGGVFAADGYARFARKPGVVLVTRGPGATNAAVGMHSASQDSIPIVLIVGHVPTASKGIEAFQEIDYHQMYGKIAKGVIEPESAAQVADATGRALRLAVAGRPGPVVLVLPRDISDGEAGDPAIPGNPGRPPAGAEPDAIARAAALLQQAKNPVLLVGEMVQWERAHNAFRQLAEASDASVMAAYRYLACYPNDDDRFLGHIELSGPPFQKALWPEYDLVVAVGTRLDDATAGRHCAVQPHQKLVHIHPDPTVLARFASTVPIQSDSLPALNALNAALSKPVASKERQAWRAGVRAKQVEFTTPGAATIHGAVDMSQVVGTLLAETPDDTVVITDGGTFARWVHRYYRFNVPDTHAGSAAGSMGYGVPSAMGAQLAMPGRTVVTFVGDGGFQMTGQELMTAVEHNIPIKVMVCDNGVWGSIMNSQTNKYSADQRFGTTIKAPDFCKLADGYGCPSFLVERTEDYRDALRGALDHNGPALIHIKTDPRDITPYGPWDP
jgi:acetolactate synthase-1/2/3 large subunit